MTYRNRRRYPDYRLFSVETRDKVNPPVSPQGSPFPTIEIPAETMPDLMKRPHRANFRLTIDTRGGQSRDVTPVNGRHRAVGLIRLIQSHLHPGTLFAPVAGMKNTLLLAVLLFLPWPWALSAAGQKPETNVNSRYEVESAALTGVSEAKVSKALREEMQKLVGQKYDQEAAQELTKKLRRELRGYSVNVKVKRGDQPDHVKVVFEAEKAWWKRFEYPLPPVVYHSKEGLSGALDIPLSFHHNVFTFGMVNSADELLERNAGFRFRYEHRKVGTDAVQLRIDFDTYHQKWNPATEAALAESPEVPGIYRTRQNLAPAISVIPLRDLKLSVGLSFQQLQIQYPAIHTDAAYAATGDIQFRHREQDGHGFRHDISAGYSVRSATRTLESDFVYTRHSWNARYTLSLGRNIFGAGFQGGLITGNAPLFERFSLGNSFTLRGWNKFDVAPIGGSRMAFGTLDYRYRPFQVFYDVGAAWDAGQSARIRHALGFGLLTKDGFFMSLGFPVRTRDVIPIFMIGFRY